LQYQGKKLVPLTSKRFAHRREHRQAARVIAPEGLTPPDSPARTRTSGHGWGSAGPSTLRPCCHRGPQPV